VLNQVKGNTMTTTPKAGVSAKVANGGAAGLLALGIAWALVQFVPAFHSGVPAEYKPLIDGAAAVAAYYATAWWSTHRATFTEVMAALDQSRLILAAEAAATEQARETASVHLVPPEGTAP
jgi:hypothetical protein